MKKMLLIGFMLSLFGCQAAPIDFEETDCDETTTAPVEEDCPPCSDVLFGTTEQDELCYDSNHKLQILQASVCQGNQVNVDECSDSICLGHQISYECYNHIMNNEYLDGNGLPSEIMNAKVAVINLMSCQYDNGGK